MTQDITPAVAPVTDAEMQAILNMSEYQQYSDDDGQIRHPVTGRIIGGKNNLDGPDDQLNVVFNTEATFNKLLTVRNGGVPQYSDQDFITISCPGENDLTVHTPVTEYYKWRFPVEFERFKQGQEELQTGMPLALWPLLTQSQIREMTNLGIRTVEQIAKLSDSNAGKFAGFHQLKLKAAQFLKLAGDKAEQGKLQLELDTRDAQHKAEMAAMKEQMVHMMSMLQAQAADKDATPVVEKTSKSK